jgi:type II secretion system protein D
MQPKIRLTWQSLILAAFLGTVISAALCCVQESRGQAALGQPAAGQAKKDIYMEWDEAPWRKVIEWLADQANLQIATTQYPTGTFSFRPVKGADKKPMKYSLGEVMDIVNETLQKQNWTVLRTNNFLYVIPASEKIPAHLVPQVNRKELEERGNSEIVRTNVAIKFANAIEIAPDLKKLLGPFGEVTPLTTIGQIQLQGRAGYLREALVVLDKHNDIDGGTQVSTMTHQCQYIRAFVAEEKLKQLMADATDSLVIKDAKGQTTTISKKLLITSNDQANTVLVTGSPSKLATAQKTLKDLDKGTGPPWKVLPYVLKQYTTPSNNAKEMAASLQELWKKISPSTMVKEVGLSTVMVYAHPEDQVLIANQIQGNDDGDTKSTIVVKMIPLRTVDAAPLALQLTKIYGDPFKGAPFIDVQLDQNAIFVRGTKVQVNDVMNAIMKIVPDEFVKESTSPKPGTGDGTEIRVINLGKGSAKIMASAVAEIIAKTRKNPIQVLTPSTGLDGLEPPGGKKLPPSEPKGKNGKPKDSASAGKSAKELTYVSKGQLFEPQGKPEKKDLPGDENAPIIITAIGNKLTVETKDKNAMLKVQQLINLIKNAEATEGDFEVIPLKFADAVEAAAVLDEVFNGKQKQGGNPNPGPFNPGQFFMQFAQGGAKPPAGPTEGKIRIVADPATNSLIVKANLLDMLTIKQLVYKAIDSGIIDSSAVIATRIIEVKNMAAGEVANIIQDVYKQAMGNTPQPVTVGGFRGFAIGAALAAQQAAANQNKKLALSIGVDDRNNVLIVQSNESIYKDIKSLVQQLDDKAANTQVTIKIIPAEGIDPYLLEQAISAITGKSTYKSSSSKYSSSSSSSYPSSPFTPSPGMFGPPAGGMFGPAGGGFGSGGKGRLKGASSRGPDFFAPAVMDDRQAPLLFDPRSEYCVEAFLLNSSHVNASEPPAEASAPAAHFASFQEGKEPPDGKGKEQPKGPTDGKGIKAPKFNVVVEPLERLGIIVLKADSEADIQEVLKIIRLIQELGQGGNIEIDMVTLEYGDATSITHTLNQLFSRVIIAAGSTTLQIGRAPAGPPQPQPGQPQPGQPQPGQPQPGQPIIQPGQPQPGQPQPGQPQPGQPGGQGAQIAAQAASTSSVFLLPIVRFNSILIAGPRARMEDIKKEIRRLDAPTSPQSKTVPFPMKNYPAAKAASLMQAWYAQRYPGDINHIRFTYDDLSNTVLVQAGPSDMDDIREMLWRLDNMDNGSTSELKIIQIKIAQAADLAVLITRAITEGAATPTTGAPGLFPQLPGQVPGVPTAPGVPTVPGQPGVPGQPTTGIPATATTGAPTKINALKLFTNPQGPDKGQTYKSSVLQDVRINADPRTNTLIIAAHKQTMDLVLALIRELDIVPPLRAEVNVFTLKNADAAAIASQLQQLFLGAAPTTGTAAPGVPGALVRPPLNVAVGEALPPLVDLRVGVDPRTNSIIVAGNPNDLLLIQAIISKLDDAPLISRHFQVVRLKNAIAADVATAINNLLVQEINDQVTAAVLNGFLYLQRNVIIVPENITNSLLISATPQYFDKVMHLLAQLDQLPPQVVIEALIGQVDYTDLNEFGVELGFQSPVLFQRSLVPGGVTLNSVSNIGSPGFNFNSTGPLGNSSNISPGAVGLQGLGNLGVGRASTVAGVGGFVFSAASQSVSILVRALRVQNRLDILSAPKLMTADNQAARIFVGQEFPYITGIVTSTALTGIPTTTNTVNYKEIGIQLQVTPKINPDGSVIMRVVPTVSKVNPNTQVTISAGVTAVAFDTQTVETTVIAQDGETIVLGGLIKSDNEKIDTKIPWLGDLPGVGALFRYRQQQKNKSELILILTPHIVRCRADADYILQEESHKISWILPQVLRTHGPHGMEPVMPGYQPPPPGYTLPPQLPGSPYSVFPSPVMPPPPLYPPQVPVPPHPPFPIMPVAPEMLPPPAITPSLPPPPEKLPPPSVSQPNGAQTLVPVSPSSPNQATLPAQPVIHESAPLLPQSTLSPYQSPTSSGAVQASYIAPAVRPEQYETAQPTMQFLSPHAIPLQAAPSQ